MHRSVNRIILCLPVFAVLLGSGLLRAQAQEAAWSPPYPLSGEVGQYKEISNVMVADDYGFVHVFWVEEEAESGQSVILHTRFDGEGWDPPIDVHVVSSQAGSLSPFVDSHNVLHLAWVEGNRGPVYYSTVPAHRAHSAAEWSPPVRLDVPAHELGLQVSRDGVLHLVYADVYGDQPGVYYTHSLDGALSWSSPVWLDPDIPRGYAPLWLEFLLDDSDGLHAVWHYLNLSQDEGTGGAVRYARSLDGGSSWSEPVTIDEPDESEDELNMALPGLAIQGRTIHVIWAGAEGTHREHRYSRDAGQTWSSTSAIFGDLYGQAQGDGLAVDGLGRIHYVGQLRYPQGLYHAFWDAGRWSTPERFYQIDRNSSDPFLGGIHAHSVRLAVRAGRQLVVTFYDRSDGRPPVLYAMHRTLGEVPNLQPQSTPQPAALEPTRVPVQPTPTVTPGFPDEGIPVSQDQAGAEHGPGYALWFGVGPTLLLLIVVAVLKSKGSAR